MNCKCNPKRNAINVISDNVVAKNVREMKRNDALEKIAEKVQRHGAG